MTSLSPSWGESSTYRIDVCFYDSLSVTAMRSVGPQPIGCCPARRCGPLWESCVVQVLEGWLRCSRTLKCSNTVTFPTSPGAQVCTSNSWLCYCLSLFWALIKWTVCVFCSAWSCWPAGVWNTKREAVCLHAGQVSPVRRLPHPEGE